MHVIKLDVLNEIARTNALSLEIVILFNNAGIMESGPMVEIPMANGGIGASALLHTGLSEN